MANFNQSAKKFILLSIDTTISMKQQGDPLQKS